MALDSEGESAKESEFVMSSIGGKAFERVKSARLEARKMVQQDIDEGLLTSSSQEEFEEAVDETVEYVIEAESLIDAQVETAEHQSIAA